MVHSSSLDGVRCTIKVKKNLAERNKGLPPERCTEFSVQGRT
jgi:hypothetical protein